MIRVHPAATGETLEAAAWYHRRSSLQGDRFLARLRDAYRTVEEAPLRWSMGRKQTRCYKMRGFPFLVVYRVWQGDIYVVAIAHGKRRPRYWLKRLGDLK